MNSILDNLNILLSNIFSSLGYEESLGLTTLSDRPELSHFQCNGALKGAKIYKKNPTEIANKVKEELDKVDYIKEVSILGPGFINITLEKDYIVKHVNEMINNDLGIKKEVNKTIVIDYGGPNIAKPLHIGHLRAAIIGESIKRITSFLGGKTIGDVHLGDWGLQMGLVLASIKDIDNITNDELNEVYPKASAKSKTDDDFKKLAELITNKLQNKEEPFYSNWKKIKEISLKDIKHIYNILNVEFDYWYGESDSEQYIEELINILTKKELLYESDGALIVDIKKDTDKKDLPPAIIKKSDGSSLYVTTDIATILGRVKEFNPDMMWYVVDSRQSLHFEQVFRVSYKSEIVNENVSLEHLGFGTMNGTDNKPYKTRDGGVMKLIDFYNTIYEKVLTKVNESNLVTNKEEVAQNIAVATIKFGDLINYREKDYIFDLDKFLLTEGKTGSFLLYTIARINSILKQINIPEDININKIESIYEEELLLKISNISNVINNSFNLRGPNIIAEDAYNLSVLFSKFYNNINILKETNEDRKKDLINICIITKTYLELYLDLLGIKSVESM